MIRIRMETMAAFGNPDLIPARDRILAALKERLPQETGRLRPSDLEGLCNRGILRADRFGLVSEHAAYVFIAATLLLGEDFDTNEKTSWSREILRDPNLPGPTKAEMLQFRILMTTGRRV